MNSAQMTQQPEENGNIGGKGDGEEELIEPPNTEQFGSRTNPNEISVIKFFNSRIFITTFFNRTFINTTFFNSRFFNNDFPSQDFSTEDSSTRVYRQKIFQHI